MSRPDVVASCEFAKRVVEAVLLATSEDVHEKLTRLDQGQPGSVLRALRLTRDRLTGEHGSEVMLKGPTAKELTVRVNELVGNVGLVGASIFDLSEEDRDHANRAPLASSISLRDELVRARSTLDRYLGSAVELRKWRAWKEAELASLVETSDPYTNVIRAQRSAEIAGEIAKVNDQETGLLGDVYEVSNDVRQSLEKRMQLLSNMIRLGLGPIPSPKVFYQPVTAEQLSKLSIEARAEAWLRLTVEQRAIMIENDFSALRNLDGLPLAEREKMQELFIKNVYLYGPEEARKWLLKMNFVDEDGELLRRFVMLDTDRKRYITAHGCDSYADIQINLEGTTTKPGDPSSTGNLDKLDKKAKYVKHKGGCVAYLNFRNADFDQLFGTNTPYFNTRFSMEDRQRYNDFVKGAGEAGDGSTFFDTRFHSAGNGMVPDFEQTRYVDRIWMDDAALNGFWFGESALPSGVFIVSVRQDGLMPQVIRTPDIVLKSILGPIGGLLGQVSGEADQTVEVDKESRRHAEEDENWLENAPDMPKELWKKLFASAVGLVSWANHEGRQKLEDIVPFDSNLESATELLNTAVIGGHSDGWIDEWQVQEEALLRRNAMEYRAAEGSW